TVRLSHIPSYPRPPASPARFYPSTPPQSTPNANRPTPRARSHARSSRAIVDPSRPPRAAHGEGSSDPRLPPCHDRECAPCPPHALIPSATVRHVYVRYLYSHMHTLQPSTSSPSLQASLVHLY